MSVPFHVQNGRRNYCTVVDRYKNCKAHPVCRVVITSEQAMHWLKQSKRSFTAPFAVYVCAYGAERKCVSHTSPEKMEACVRVEVYLVLLSHVWVKARRKSFKLKHQLVSADILVHFNACRIEALSGITWNWGYPVRPNAMMNQATHCFCLSLLTQWKCTMLKMNEKNSHAEPINSILML